MFYVVVNLEPGIKDFNLLAVYFHERQTVFQIPLSVFFIYYMFWIQIKYNVYSAIFCFD